MSQCLKFTTQTSIIKTDLKYNLEDWFNFICIDEKIIKKTGFGIGKCFKNCFSLSLIWNSKKINFKIYNNGSIQVTGSLDIDTVLYVFILLIKDAVKNKIIQEQNIKISIKPVMVNMQFKIKSLSILNFQERLDELNSSFFSYTLPKSSALNIKKEISQTEYESTLFQNYTLTNGILEKTKYNNFVYLSKNKKRYTTFLVFKSGNILVSGNCTEQNIKAINDFQKILKILNLS